MKQQTKRKARNTIYALQTAIEIGQVVYPAHGGLKIVFRLTSLILPFIR